MELEVGGRGLVALDGVPVAQLRIVGAQEVVVLQGVDAAVHGARGDACGFHDLLSFQRLELGGGKDAPIMGFGERVEDGLVSEPCGIVAEVHQGRVPCLWVLKEEQASLSVLETRPVRAVVCVPCLFGVFTRSWRCEGAWGKGTLSRAGIDGEGVAPVYTGLRLFLLMNSFYQFLDNYRREK